MPPRSTYDILTSFGTARPVAALRFRKGQKVKLPAELGGKVGVICEPFGGIYASAWRVQVGDVFVAVDEQHLSPAAPEWRPGDVVVVRFESRPAVSYTYVRGAVDWPGDRRPSKPDAFFDRLYLMGRATPVLQAGGEPFDKGRL